jgi:hypothetical protein
MVHASAWVRTAGAMPPSRSRANMKVVETTMSPSLRPSRTGSTSPATMATARIAIGTSTAPRTAGPRRAARATTSANPSATTAAM